MTLDPRRSLHPLTRLRAVRGTAPACRDAVASFFTLPHADVEEAPCLGTACWHRRRVAGVPNPEGAGVYCRGRCYGNLPAIPRRSLTDEPIVLRNVLGHDAAAADYMLPTGPEIMDAVGRSGLRGRGGAAGPIAAGWIAARDTPSPDRVVVANGDEGEPGSYVDRLLLEEAPHSVLAGMVACARAIGASRAYLVVRGEYPKAIGAVQEAIEEAHLAGWLGEVSIELFEGTGSYVCGEETALLRAVEGGRADGRPRSPHPATSDPSGLPCVVENVETLSLVPWVVRHGAQPRTKGICVSGAVREPGVFEIELGTTVWDVLEGAGGAVQGSEWTMAVIGGPMGRVLPAYDFDAALDFDTLPGMGHGAIVVLDQTVSPREVAEHLFSFARDACCARCGPCRLGTAALHTAPNRDALERLLETLETGSPCGFGRVLPRPIRDLLKAFGDDLFR